jgi:tetratricopeptide (TPR) repeat protein
MSMRKNTFRIILPICLLLLLTGCFGGDEASDPNFVPEFKDFPSAIASGDKFLSDDKTEQAISAYLQATELDKKNPDGFFQLGVALAERERLLEEQGRLSSTTSSPESKGKKELTSREAFEKSIDLYNARVKTSPSDHEAFFNLGRALNRLDRDSEAEKSFREAVRLSPQINEYRIKLGETLMKLAKWSEAVSILRKAAEIEPDNFDLSEKIESAELGRKRLAFAPSPSPTPTPEEPQN